jgi:hypothetical protein
MSTLASFRLSRDSQAAALNAFQEACDIAHFKVDYELTHGPITNKASPAPREPQTKLIVVLASFSRLALPCLIYYTSFSGLVCWLTVHKEVVKKYKKVVEAKQNRIKQGGEEKMSETKVAVCRTRHVAATISIIRQSL